VLLVLAVVLQISQ